MSDYASVGMTSPHVLRVTITPSPGQSFDMTHVSQVILGVQAPDRVTLWDAIIVSQTAASMVIEKPFFEGDLLLQGEYKLVPNLNTPNGFVQGSPIHMWVYE